MANLNKVMLIGRLTRDPEMRTFSNGGKVAKFGFAVNNRKKNMTSGQWEDEPVFIEVDCFNRGENGRKADLVEQWLRKGSQVFIEGHLKLDQWTSQDGQKRSQLRVVVDNFEFLTPKSDSQGGGGGRSSGNSYGADQPPMQPPNGGSEYEESPSYSGSYNQPAPGPDADIPF